MITAQQLVRRLVEDDYPIDDASKYRSSTKELAKLTAPDAVTTQYRDLYAEYDEPISLLAFDVRGEITGAIGYSVSAKNMLEAVASLQLKCDRRLRDLNQPVAALDPQAWFKYQTARGLTTFIGSAGKARAVVSRFNDCDLDGRQVNSLFMFFMQTGQQDAVALFNDPDKPKTKDVTMAKFGRLARRSVRHEVTR